MNDFFDSLKDIKKEMIKEISVEKKETKPQISKEEAIANREKKLKDEFLAYTKNHNITKF